jgi:hypothetical protein
MVASASRKYTKRFGISPAAAAVAKSERRGRRREA